MLANSFKIGLYRSQINEDRLCCGLNIMGGGASVARSVASSERRNTSDHRSHSSHAPGEEVGNGKCSNKCYRSEEIIINPYGDGQIQPYTLPEVTTLVV